MRTIAIDTSLASGSVAACDGSRLAVRPLGEATGHARLLASAVTAAAAELGWRLADAEVVAVIRGPGSFTGLRVGVAAAKAIAWASGCRLVGVSGFEVVAAETAATAGWHGQPLAIAWDAGRGDVYAATARKTDGGWQVSPGVLQAADDWIAGLPTGSLVAGPALNLLGERLSAAGHHLAPESAWHPTAAAAAALALPRAIAGQTDDPATLLPEYARPSYADERAGQPKA
ncbi:MAG: tRNA (adenosine(37)-N6)-threonylcarbamoyltransferase complex dimerization subunit type 1 TsaB [Planctomycetota bacterium]|jgi:tRNA threonylcarbamoyladenosine biosynthesis protein TsaB|nr:tRNA (adenosine(37)-N6)-threonylcarbamoyltransferase complex dimerization subunit type 1 TsaB [Planctomycetota bacterium]